MFVSLATEQSAIGLVTLQAQVEVHLTSSARPLTIARSSPTSARDEYLFPRRQLENYEDLLDPLGEAHGPPISDNEVELQLLTPIATAEVFGS
jgi:hypothetical protein